MPSKAMAARAVMEGIKATNATVFVDTGSARVNISTDGYRGSVVAVGLNTSSNVVISNDKTDKCVIYSTGSITCKGTISDGVLNFSSSTYAPSFNCTTNCDSVSTTQPFLFTRIGNQVFVAGYIAAADATAANTLTRFRITLPISTTFTILGDAGGAGNCFAAGNNFGAGNVVANTATGNEVAFIYYPNNANAMECSLNFQYIVK